MKWNKWANHGKINKTTNYQGELLLEIEKKSIKAVDGGV